MKNQETQPQVTVRDLFRTRGLHGTTWYLILWVFPSAFFIPDFELKKLAPQKSQWIQTQIKPSKSLLFVTKGPWTGQSSKTESI